MLIIILESQRFLHSLPTISDTWYMLFILVLVYIELSKINPERSQLTIL